MNKYEEERLKYTTQLPLGKGLVLEVNSDFDLYLWSDIHVGAMEFNIELFKNSINHLKKNKMGRVILAGDLIEGIPRGYKISERGQYSTPDFQIEEFQRLIKPVQDRVDIIYKGNHNTESRGESIDSDFIIAQMLNVPYKTVPTVVQYLTKKGVIKVCGGHGKSGAVNPDLELERLAKIFPDNHIYHLGHTHHLYAKQTGALRYDEQGKEQWVERWISRTGNFLNYAEYARYSFYTPQRSGFPIFKVRNGQIMEAIVITDDDFK